MEQYTFEGVTYNVAPNRLQDFLAKYPNAEKVEKTQGVAAPDAVVTPLPVLDDTGLASVSSQPTFPGAPPKVDVEKEKVEKNFLGNMFEIGREYAESISTAKYSAVQVLSVPLAVTVSVSRKIVKKNSPGFNTASKSLPLLAPP